MQQTLETPGLKISVLQPLPILVSRSYRKLKIQFTEPFTLEIRGRGMCIFDMKESESEKLVPFDYFY